MADALALTYQTNLLLDEKSAQILLECAALLSRVERSLYAEIASGKTSAACKNDFLKKYGITARQFNACRISLEGKIAACRTGQEQALFSLKQQIETLDKQIHNLKKKPSKSFILHQKKRRKAILLTRLSCLEKDHQANRTHLCFGTKKLFRAQFYLEKNGFSSQQEWLKAWKQKRNSEFFVLGSKDETAGNQTCVATVQQDGRFCLRVRLPNQLVEKYGKYLEIPNVCFAYGQEAILASLNNSEGQAISYRFKKEDRSWKVFVTTDLKKPERTSLEGQGVIGLDLNTDHIACAETDRFGNLIWKKVFPWISYGKTRNQLKAATGEICKQIIERAKTAKKPIVIEQLDFKRKKLTLKEQKGSKFSRLLSSFAYALFFNFVTARAFKQGIAVHRVNPAFTSVIGCVNYAKRYGLSVHLAAALCIARRDQKFSEAPCSPQGKIPDGKGGHVAFVLPVRNRTKHVWHFWGQVKKKLTTVLAAHFRAKSNRSKGPNWVLETSNSRLLLVKPQYVNR